MRKQVFDLWENAQTYLTEKPLITAYIPNHNASDCAMVILPGGAYSKRAGHEGENYAKFFCKKGICSFVCDYRVSPNYFPIELMDSRRAIQFVRYHAKEFGIDKQKIVIVGSSAGGHLAALTSTYFERILPERMDAVDEEDFVPNAQVLCYPVIKLSVDSTESHVDSCINLLGVEQLYLAYALTPANIVSKKTPKCFMWHTAEDGEVPMLNSMEYARALKKCNISCEFHIFPEGRHGLGLAEEDDVIHQHVSQWKELLIKWLRYIEFI